MLTEDDRSVWSQLSAPARYQKKKVWTDPRFRHVGSIGKFVPCFDEDGEPTATQKGKRSSLMEMFGELVDDMYGERTEHPGGDMSRVHGSGRVTEEVA